MVFSLMSARGVIVAPGTAAMLRTCSALILPQPIRPRRTGIVAIVVSLLNPHSFRPRQGREPGRGTVVASACEPDDTRNGAHVKGAAASFFPPVAYSQYRRSSMWL